MLFVYLSRGGVKALTDRCEHVFVLRPIRLCLRDVGLLWLFELDTDAVAPAFALMAMGLGDDDATAQDRAAETLKSLVLGLDSLYDSGRLGSILKLDLQRAHTEKL